jgi:hypothetical protein
VKDRRRGEKEEERRGERDEKIERIGDARDELRKRPKRAKENDDGMHFEERLAEWGRAGWYEFITHVSLKSTCSFLP